MQVDVDRICRAVLAAGATEQTLDAWLGRACQALCGRDADAATRVVARVVSDHARRRGCTRMAAVAEIARSEATAEARVYAGADELAPELRAQFERMKAEGRPGPVERTGTLHWDASQGPPSPEMLGAVRARFPDARVEADGRIVMGRRRSWRRLLLRFALALFLGILPALIVLFAALREPRTAAGRMAAAVGALEGEHRRRPEDRQAGFRLAEAYARLLVHSRGIAGRGAEGAGLSVAVSAEREALASLPLQDYARRGEELVRLLGAGEATPAERAALHVLMGHLLLTQGRRAEAAEAARQACELAPADIRPRLLAAAVCEAQGQYDLAAAELDAAQGCLSAWPPREGSPLGSLLWESEPGFHRTPAPAEERRPASADDLRLRLELGAQRLRLLAGRSGPGA